MGERVEEKVVEAILLSRKYCCLDGCVVQSAVVAWTWTVKPFWHI